MGSKEERISSASAEIRPPNAVEGLENLLLATV